MVHFGQLEWVTIVQMLSKLVCIQPIRIVIIIMILCHVIPTLGITLLLKDLERHV